MKVLLIQPDVSTIRGLPQPPLALIYVGGYAEKFGYTVKILDRSLETNSRKFIEDFQPDVVGVTALTGKMLIDAIKISKYIKEKYPKVKIVWGGIHTTLMPENTLENEFIDFVVLGEGEVTFVELLDAIEGKRKFRDILGLGFKENGQMIINERRPPIDNLDQLPLISWHLIDTKKYLKHETLIITSRGCPGECSFCYNEKFSFRRWRGMSPKKVKEEIEHAQKYHPISRFRFDDDNFVVNKKRFYEIIEFLPKDMPLYFETRVDYVDEEFCRRLSEFKDVFLFLGVESGDDEVLKKMKKGFSTDRVREAFKLFHKYNIKTTASFIIGSPGETREQVEKTIKFIDELNSTRPSCCIYVPFPGAVFTQDLMREGKLDKFKKLEDWGRLTDAEFAGDIQFSNVPSQELNNIYNKFWRKFVWSFIKNIRIKWLYLGFTNQLKMYYRRFMRWKNNDI